MNVNGGASTGASGAATGVAELPPAVAPAEAAKLRGLLDDVRAAERHLARAVLAAGELAGSGVSERIEGLPLELLLALACRMTGRDRRTLVAAGETLADMPATAKLFADGAISWGQVRAVVGAVRRLAATDRAALDARIAASATRHDGIDAYDPDQLVWAVEQAVEEFRSARAAERAEQRRREHSFVSVQASLDGGVRLYAELDPVRGATFLNALDSAAGRPAGEAASGGADGPGTDEGHGAAPEVWSPTPRARQYADALEAICAEWLSGGAGRPARPLLVAHVDLSQLRHRPDGTVELAVRGGDHHPDNLVSLSRRFHTMVHAHGWRLSVTPETGMVTARRRHRAWRGLPRGTPLADRADPGDDDPAPTLPF